MRDPGHPASVVGYLVNQYPKVSHTFIRREILALESQGQPVQRYALRGWADEVKDPVDKLERGRTRYVLNQHAALLSAVITLFLTRPLRSWHALRLAIRLSRGADRPLLVHLIYLAEACLVARWCQYDGVSHLHAHFGTNPAAVAMLVHALGGPSYSFTVHGPEEFDKPLAIGLAEKIRHARFVVAISSFGRSQLSRWVSSKHWEKLAVVHCGIEHAFHADVGATMASADSASSGSSQTTTVLRRRLVCVGRLCEQKAQLLLVEAAQLVRDRGHRFELVLAGDGEMRAEIESRIRELRLTDMVSITGWISSEQVRDEILAARALVLPSFAEGLPVVLMEAMALGRPVISTYVAGIPELVSTPHSGWLVPAGDVSTLADAMVECLLADTIRLQEMGMAARARALARHDIDVEASKLVRLFAGQARPNEV